MAAYDFVVIGSGPGGYVAAIRAAHHGLKTALVEKDAKLGGTCLLRGCIPTKSLLHSADLFNEVSCAKNHGITTGTVSFDFSAIQKSRQRVVKKSAAGVSYLMKQNKIDVHLGLGSLKDKNTVVVDNVGVKTELQAKTIVLATGSVPTTLPFINLDGKHFVSSNEMLELQEPPKSLIVLGAGAVGVEFASIYATFGTQCTVVEMLDQALPNEDSEVSAEFKKLFKKRGIEILTGTKVEKAEVKNGNVVATLATKSDSQTIEASMCLVAVGRRPVTQKLGLEKLGIQVDKQGYVGVNEFMQTGTGNIYAIGDIVRTPLLAHIASAEALVAADHAAGKSPRPLDYLQTPSCTYATPEVASVGLTERAAKEKGYTVKIGKFPYMASGKARIMGQTEGFVKIVSDAQYDEILGVHIIGSRATDLIAEACVAIRLECTTEELAHTIHAHPTLPEIVLEAAHSALGRPLHL